MRAFMWWMSLAGLGAGLAALPGVAGAAVLALAPFEIRCSGGGCNALVVAEETAPGTVVLDQVTDITVGGSVEVSLDGPAPVIEAIDLDLVFSDFLLVARGTMPTAEGLAVYEGELARHATRLPGSALALSGEAALAFGDGALSLMLPEGDPATAATLTVPVAPAPGAIRWRNGIVGPDPVAGEIVLSFLPGSVVVALEGRAAAGFADPLGMWSGMSGGTRLSASGAHVLAMPADAAATLVSTPVPPAGALILAGLGALGLVARRAGPGARGIRRSAAG